MKDLFIEIWESLKRNKLRTTLTGFAVAWGIFMLIVLLGAGNGLMNAFMFNGRDFASNTMMIFGGYTTQPYDGLEQGRDISLNDKDIELSESHLFSNHIDDVTANITQGPYPMVWKNKSVSVSLSGSYPKIAEMDKITIEEGRFINNIDMQQRRKTAVIASTHAKQLLNGGTDYAYFLGKHLKIGNSMYKIVGIYKAQDNMRNNDVYVPFTTMQMLTNNYNYEDHIIFTFHGLNTEQENEEFERQYRAVLNQSHRAAPNDDGAIWIWNRFTQNMQMNKGTSILSKALWIIGILTLLGGIVGVSNIMLITVKERTHEFGIRKAIGATPSSIMKLIVAESVTITALFGYIGMFLGLVACEIMDATVGKSSLEMFGEKVSVFVDPTVGLDVAFGVTLVLIIAGTIAGLSPALKAARIRPIEALRNE
ncbi:MAG: ABC transporter permease [Bacteroidales bacterium]|nr:ABC transporter permease [Bacteroidales bacterium]